MACGRGRTPGPAAELFDLQDFSGPVGGELHECAYSQGTGSLLMRRKQGGQGERPSAGLGGSGWGVGEAGKGRGNYKGHGAPGDVRPVGTKALRERFARERGVEGGHLWGKVHP